jgi:hypothetical protein
MSKIKILEEDQSYTFGSYFELPYEADEILAEFDYSLQRTLPCCKLRLAIALS